MFAENWNGISLLWDVSTQRADITVTSDTSGSWGLWESRCHGSLAFYTYPSPSCSSGSSSVWISMAGSLGGVQGGQYGSNPHPQQYLQ